MDRPERLVASALSTIEVGHASRQVGHEIEAQVRGVTRGLLS